MKPFYTARAIFSLMFHHVKLCLEAPPGCNTALPWAFCMSMLQPAFHARYWHWFCTMLVASLPP